MAGHCARVAHGHGARRRVLSRRACYAARSSRQRAQPGRPNGYRHEALIERRRINRQRSRETTDSACSQRMRREPNRGRQKTRHEPPDVASQAPYLWIGEFLTMAVRVQELIHKLEEGTGYRYLKFLLAIFGMVAAAVAYDLAAFRNLSTRQGMDAAQLAWNLSEGRGFSTFFIRPFSVYLLDKKALAATADVSQPGASTNATVVVESTADPGR